MALIPLPADVQLDDQQPALVPLPDHVALDQPNGAPATIDDSVQASSKRVSIFDRVSDMLKVPQATAINDALKAPQSTFLANYIPGGKYAMAGTRYVADRIVSPIDAIQGKAPSFADEFKSVNQELNQFSDSHPVVSGAMATAGMLTNPVYNKIAGVVGEAIPKVASTVNGAVQTAVNYARYGLQGGTVGAVAGVLDATAPDGGLPSVDDVERGAKWGGGLGVATGIAAPVIAKGAGNVIGKIRQRIAGSAPTMTQAEIKAASQAAYKASEDAGVIVTPKSFEEFATNLPGELKGYHPAVTDGAAKIVKMLQGEAATGPLTLERIDALRSVASGASINPTNPNEARLAGHIVDKLDDFIDGLTPDKLIGGNADDAIPALREARALWKTQAKLKTISDIVDTGENLNDTNWVKGRFRAIVKNPKAFNRYTAEEKKLIAEVARTGVMGKIIRMIPLRGVQMTTQYAEPVMQDRQIGALQDLIARGASPPPVPLRPLMTPDLSGNALNSYARRSGNLLNTFSGP